MLGTNILEQRKDACKTYLEQTKLLVTLASAFILAPVALLDKTLQSPTLSICMEICFILSVLSGYFVFGTIAGSQDDGTYDVYRGATRIGSLIQLIFYIVGLVFLTLVFFKSVEKPTTEKKGPPTIINQTITYTDTAKHLKDTIVMHTSVKRKYIKCDSLNNPCKNIRYKPNK